MRLIQEKYGIFRKKPEKPNFDGKNINSSLKSFDNHPKDHLHFYFTNQLEYSLKQGYFLRKTPTDIY